MPYLVKLKNILVFSSLMLLVLSGCARDLSSRTYTSDSTFNVTLEGKVVSASPITIKESDKLQDNSTGMATGAIAGGVAGGAMGGNNGSIIAGALIGGLAGTFAESELSKSAGIEYIVKVDTSKLKDGYYNGSRMMSDTIAAAKASGMIAVIQSKDHPIGVGQDVYVIISPKRVRVMAR